MSKFLFQKHVSNWYPVELIDTQDVALSVRNLDNL